MRREREEALAREVKLKEENARLKQRESGCVAAVAEKGGLDAVPVELARGKGIVTCEVGRRGDSGGRKVTRPKPS